MPQIRPVSELRNNFAEISKTVHENTDPIFLTKNGYGDMVVMSIEAYENLVSESYIFNKLKNASFEAKSSDKRYSFDEIAKEMREKLIERI